MKNELQTDSTTQLLNEIFMAPSQEVLTNRFNALNDDASCGTACGGNCGGSCSFKV